MGRDSLGQAGGRRLVSLLDAANLLHFRHQIGQGRDVEVALQQGRKDAEAA
jgi:hypothetical protein